jgi:hypothetical protein
MRSVFLLFFIFTSSLFSKEEHVLIVNEKQLVDDNIIKSASIVEISGRVTKDVYVSAAQVIVDGVIEGDLICACGTLQITGTVKGSVRGLCAQVLITGSVGKNITLVSSSFTSTPSCNIAGSCYLAGGSFDLSGNYKSPVFIGANNVRLDGNFLNDINLYAGDIWIGMDAQVKNSLVFHSENPIHIHPQAKLSSQPINRSLQERFLKKFDLFDKILLGSKVAGLLMNFFFTIIAGFFYLRIWPHALKKSAFFINQHLAKCFFHGILFVLVAPIVGLLLLITILGIPIAITLVLFSILGLYAAKIHTLNYLSVRLKSRWLKARSKEFLFVMLCVVYFMILPIPYLGIIMSSAATLVGIGAAMHSPRVKLKN